MPNKIINLDAIRAGYDRRCRKGCEFSSKVHAKCPEHGGRSKHIMTLEELAIQNIELAHEVHTLKKQLKLLRGGDNES